MALCISLHKSQHLLPRYFLSVFGNKLLKCLIHSHDERSVTLEADILDDFTTQLVQKKSNKWEIMRTRRKLNNEQVKFKAKQEENKIDIGYMDVNQLDTVLRDIIEADNYTDIKDILYKCSKCEKIPSLSVLLQILSIYSQSGDKNTIVEIIELCDKVSPKILKENSYFKHYLAEATWVKGNINEAVAIFEDVYRNNVYLRRRIRNMLKYLIQDTIINRSEAALLNIIKFAERVLEDFRDFYPLACIWQTCFLSEWFTDQCIALDLLKQNEGLYKVVSNQLPYVVAVALKNHQTEVVYRLLEILLKYEQKSQYVMVLEALFDYRVHQGDLRGCSEIIKWSLKQDIVLPTVQQERFVKLLLTYSKDSPQVFDSQVTPKVTSPPSFRFKF